MIPSHLRVIYRTIRQSSDRLIRFLRIAESLFRFGVVPLSSPTPTTPMHHRPRSMSMLRTRECCLQRSIRQSLPPMRSLMSFRRNVTSTPHLSLSRSRSSLTSSQTSLSIVQIAAPRVLRGVEGKPFPWRGNTINPPPQKSRNAPATHSIALARIIQAVVLQNTRLAENSRIAKSLSEHVRMARPLPATALAPVGYYHLGGGQRDVMIGPRKGFTGAIWPRPSSSGSSAAHSEKARYTPGGLQDNGDKGKGEQIAQEGRFYLEGSALGHWLIKRLNLEISQPRSGIMAVDPRITPSWGGPSLAT